MGHLRKASIPFMVFAQMFLSATAAAAPASHSANEPDFVASLTKAFGGKRGTYFVRNTSISDQIFMGLGIPDQHEWLPDGAYFQSGLRPHSADEMSAVVATRTGRFLAAALVHYPCVFVDPKAMQQGCLTQATLTIFVTREGDQPKYMGLFENWAKNNISQMYDKYFKFSLNYIEKKRLPLR